MELVHPTTGQALVVSAEPEQSFQDVLSIFTGLQVPVGKFIV
jgi:hypothetical protein